MKKQNHLTSVLAIAAFALSSLFMSCGDTDDGEESIYTLAPIPSPSDTELTITFNANDGSASPATVTQTVTAGSSVALNENTFTRSGYSFKGWASSATASTVLYKDKGTATFYNATTLYAVWASEPVKFTITLDSNNGSGKTKTVTKESGKYILFSSYKNVFTKDNATLYAFNTKADRTGTRYFVSIGGSLEVTENTTLYAEWLENPKITFDANGGAASDGSTEAYQYLAGIYTAFTGEWKFSALSSKTSSGTSVGVPMDYWAAALNKNTFTREGYEFLGWNGSSTATTPQYTDEQYVEKAFSVGQLTWENKYGTKELISNKVFYAVWKQK